MLACLLIAAAEGPTFESKWSSRSRSPDAMVVVGPGWVLLCATDESQVGLCNGDSGAIIGVGASD